MFGTATVSATQQVATDTDIDTSFQNLVTQSYAELMELPAKKYPDEIMRVTDTEDLEKFSVSTLGLWSLRTAYDQGSFKVRTSDMDKL